MKPPSRLGRVSTRIQRPPRDVLAAPFSAGDFSAAGALRNGFESSLPEPCVNGELSETRAIPELSSGSGGKSFAPPLVPPEFVAFSLSAVFEGSLEFEQAKLQQTTTIHKQFHHPRDILDLKLKEPTGHGPNGLLPCVTLIEVEPASCGGL